MKSVYSRIVSLVPSTTETLFAIGAGKKIIGVTSFCIHPKAGVKTITKVGGTKTLKVDKIIKIKPDLVIANIEENVKSEIEELQSAELNVLLTHPITCEDSINHIKDLGDLTGREEAAQEIAREQEKFLKEMKNRSKKHKSVLYLIWKNPYMTINKNTYIHSLIEAAGGINVTANAKDRYPKITFKEIEILNPEVILLPSEPYDFKEDDMQEFLKNKKLNASKAGNIFLINGEDTCWFGPRMKNGLISLTEIFNK